MTPFGGLGVGKYRSVREGSPCGCLLVAGQERASRHARA